MNFKKIINPALLVLAALIWGVAFVAQKSGAGYVGPFALVSTRSFIGGTALIPVIFLLGNKAPKPITGEGKKKDLLLGGLLCGTALFAASFFQQWGIDCGTNAGKAGFITALYIVIVALCGIVIKKKVSIKVLIAVLVAVSGLYLLCVTENSVIVASDLLVLVCAFIFACHIMVIDYFSPRVECLKMSMIQFFVCGTLSLIAMFISGEKNTLKDLMDAYIPILYLGIMSSGVGYTLQIVGQRGTDPTLASILMSLESVFAVLAGTLFGERLDFRQISGCVLMFAAIIMAQLPSKEKKKCE